MRRFVKAVSSSIVMQAVLSVLLGLFLTMWPQATTVTVVYLFAAYLAITGIVSLISYARHRSERDGYRGALATGILMVVLALVVFVFPEAVAGFFSLILGARWRGDYREPVRYDRNVRFSARVASRCQGRDRSRCGMARFEQIEGGRRVTRKAGAHVHLAFTNKILQHCSTASHMVFVLLQYSSVALRRTSKVL